MSEYRYLMKLPNNKDSWEIINNLKKIIDHKHYKIRIRGSHLNDTKIMKTNPHFTYKDLISHASGVSNTIKKPYITEPDGVIPFYIKSKTVLLSRSEANRLSETLNDALTSVRRAYELGLYL